MKKQLVFLMVFVVGISAVSFLFAATQDEPKRVEGRANMPTSPDMERRGMGMMNPSMMNNMMMMQAMRERSIVPTSDGGVLVVVGSQMMKYDKDLNLVKEAELKINMDKIREGMMSGMPSQNSSKPSELKKEKS